MSKGKDIKPHIGIFGRRNNGKSSFINFLVGQDIAIVSDHAGTTTDPVKKSVEIFGIGPAILVDTAGIDDSGDLGEKRIAKTLEMIKNVDCAIILIANNQFGDYELDLIEILKYNEVPYLIVHNKSDIARLSKETIAKIQQVSAAEFFDFSVKNPINKDVIIEALKRTIPKTAYQNPSLFGGIVKPKDIVLLITPIDSEAPDGRMILPQVMAWRDLLDNDCICMSVKETELEDFMKLGIKPALVVTDSQAFEFVSKLIPQEIPLTGFSIVFSRVKGNSEKYLEGTPHISNLKDGDNVLMLESCTHQVSCEDIGRQKLPNWIKKFTGKEISFDIVSGLSNLPANISEYSLVIQCGGCMATQKQIINRLKTAINEGVPITNYGMAIAYMYGIFERATAPFRK
ncbi:MAG TPA: [FeFe] hydrogenase H-cluster maturation GTPase HydF [Bacteroidales bacterium]|nr:MAG: [FeFe] hydrogenase H-cluster maturation GTPase HydF [Bacteroidetes bacterium GWF2_33_38]OFY67932.1 MAG: [FeFe] hydrogenase H-cluster maturation GTPase HydF [Bacteroidetes bacterium RIFOXYA12_FULL_33_9]OFY85284.1 MAG: [FeFe] hydrogenase H-cluster maturation GTPase HydF [Bacteroidetes bacterium RIFOXYA2_FULL_33_7]HBF87482.1 [FeFe] hydrogenase H-cluster maturation GTPase HydF [Bacteroidales bacterium]